MDTNENLTKKVESPVENNKVADTNNNSNNNRERRSPYPNNGNRERHFGNNDRNNQDRRNFRRKPFNNNPEEKQFEEKVVNVSRVTKVTKGGRHFRFAAVVVIGDKKGRVGFGTGKANEVPDAIKKAIKEAKKNIVKVPIVGTTVPHEVIGKFGASEVLIKPARKGTGVIAGGPARAIIELAGLADVYTKSLGANTPINMIRATLAGLKELRTADQIAKLRHKNVGEVQGK